MSALTLFDGPRCSQCARPLPDDSRRDRETCSPACRQRASRHARSVTPETGGAVGHDSATSRPATGPHGSLAAIAAGIVTPADGYGPARAYCTAEAGGYRVIFWVDGGRRNEPIGPVFATPREAIDLSRLLNRRLEASA